MLSAVTASEAVTVRNLAMNPAATLKRIKGQMKLFFSFYYKYSIYSNLPYQYKLWGTPVRFDKVPTTPPVLPLDPRWQLRPCCVPLQPLDPDQGGACRAWWIAAGSRAAGVNHMNVPPEQIESGEAGRPGRPRRSAQLHALTSKAVLEGGGGGEEERRESTRAGPNSSKASLSNACPDMQCSKTEWWCNCRPSS